MKDFLIKAKNGRLIVKDKCYRGHGSPKRKRYKIIYLYQVGSEKVWTKEEMFSDEELLEDLIETLETLYTPESFKMEFEVICLEEDTTREIETKKSETK